MKDAWGSAKHDAKHKDATKADAMTIIQLVSVVTDQYHVEANYLNNSYYLLKFIKFLLLYKIRYLYTKSKDTFSSYLCT